MTSRHAAVLLCALVLGACASRGTPAGGDPAEEIPAMLRASAQSWNRGDLDAFLDDYQDAPTTTFLGGQRVVRGVDEIRAGYERGFFSEGALPDSLSFADVEVRPLGDRHALAIGRFILNERGSGELASTGWFTLVLARTPAGWRIIHDHSSNLD